MIGPVILATGLFALQTPTFRTSARLVEVNVIVHDRHGVVDNLAKEDFSLTDRGKPRNISIFSVSRPDIRLKSPPLPAGTFSNHLTTGESAPNVTVVLLDALNSLYYGTSLKDGVGPTHFENQSLGFAKDNVMRFVKDLKPDDRVAIYALGKSSLRVLCDFTSSHAQLQQVLQNYRDSAATMADIADPPSSALPTQGDFNGLSNNAAASAAALANMDRSGMTARALLAISNHVASISGRKNLIWLTGSVPLSGAYIGRLLARANLAIYPVDARGLTTSFDPHYRPSGQEEMRELATQTGGHAFVNTNDLSSAIRKAIDDSSVTYLLGFYIDEEELDGKFHEIRVHAKGSGIELRYPRGYFATPLKLTANERQRAMDAALSSPLESSAVHILARVEREDKLLRISGSIDVGSLHLAESEHTRTGAVELLLVQQNGSGHILDRSPARLSIAFNEEQYSAALKSGVLFRQNIMAKEGATVLRIIAADLSTSQSGSLIIPLSRVPE